MRDELAKFGVRCEESDDGITVFPVAAAELEVPTHGVHCYDDHRVAMAFSVLAAVLPRDSQGVVIREKRCVQKTWPGYWDMFSATLSNRVEGFECEP